jgi:mannose-6-phosphate isomerase-like protein (cupin superfamily)
MRIIDHERQPSEEWREGVLTRMRISAITGSVQLCLFEQWCEPGKGAPTHLHAVEEILTVLQGRAECWIEDERLPLSAGQSLIVPAGRKHGFRNSGLQTLHVQATLAAPIFEASFDDQHEVSRRWVPQPAHGLSQG